MRCARGGPVYKHSTGLDPLLQARAAVFGELLLEEMIQPPFGILSGHIQFHESSQVIVFPRRSRRLRAKKLISHEIPSENLYRGRDPGGALHGPKLNDLS